ncbi:hypothetical protein ASPACDRAFT_42303 [Aspergillus aculeatus ATCC 16872]|uniref:Xylanolytic transcriptional activator regulatory domain-containing protein n=1 Tax=Aspergillus aculeatus (strain ATCC 16872 / CBS 172.66 / WB 5094) TaxID=690307 RepID=A0A1L9WXF2_ASPA1|nr:uncharacterized protein ASPACDRAFT_42303 [Aspergillus aculeatus ATCC 16872]OJK00813.1 hypothetical protein ASPACDRAFT_42303 [Aspergillus aculeatus ATCC 16872]
MSKDIETTINFILSNSGIRSMTGTADFYTNAKDKRAVKIYDPRGKHEFKLSKNGFCHTTFPSVHILISDPTIIKLDVYPEIARLLETSIQPPPTRIKVVSNTIRSSVTDVNSEYTGTPGLARAAHLDHTSSGAKVYLYEKPPEEEASRLSRTRWAIINVWRPLKTISRDPLAVCDGCTLQEGDLLPKGMKYSANIRAKDHSGKAEDHSKTTIHQLSEPSCFWSILGFVIRKAQAIGLHRDGMSLGLSQYECEIRRRVWWYLVALEIRASELAGAVNSVVSQSWDTNFPTNIDDQDLHPEIKILTSAADRLTDMSFCLFQYEAVRLFRSVYLETSPEVMLRTNPRMLLSLARIKVFRRTVEDKFLRFCDPVIPMHFMLNSFARLTLCKMEASSQEIRPKARKNQHSSLWDSDSKLTYGLRMLEYDRLLHSNQSVHGFRWFIYAHFPWGALIWLLQAMLTKDLGMREENTWHHVKTLYQRYPEMYNEDRGLHRLVNTLVLRVWCLRQTLRKGAALQSEVEAAPHFITELLSKPYIRNDQAAPVGSPETLHNKGANGVTPFMSETTTTEHLENWDQSMFISAASPESSFDFGAWLI